MNSIRLWWRMMGYLRPYRRSALLAALGLGVGTLLAVVVPRVLELVIDVGIGNSDRGFMVWAGLLVVGLGVLRGAMGFVGRYFGERLSHEIAYDMRNALYAKVQRLPFAFHDRTQVGTLITRAISDVDEVQRYFAFGLLDGLSLLALLVGVAAMMLVANPVLAAVALLPMIPLAFFSVRFVLAVDPRWKAVMERIQVLSNQLQENAVGAQVVRAFARERYERGRFGEQNAKLYDEQLDLVQQWGSFLPLSAFIAAVPTVLVLLVGGWMIDNNWPGVTVGQVVAFNAYVLLLAQPMRFIGFVILLVTQAVSSVERVFEVLDEPEPLQSKPGAQRITQAGGHVRFENVTFAYEGAPSPALVNVSLDAPPGKIIAIMGATGSGKSSVVNLIPRFYDVTGGRVLFDGADVRDLDLNDLRNNIGFVLQESLLFSATLRENIAFGRHDATEAQVVAAAKAADAHDFITSFPDGYDTVVGERGVTLSGGQRQRVAIARALLLQPAVLILDDATSSVDTRTEQAIQQALTVIMAQRTTFIVAQRVSSVVNADEILFLRDGRVVERGSHEALLQQDGDYAALYHLQMAEQERLRRETRLTDRLDDADSESVSLDRRAAGR